MEDDAAVRRGRFLLQLAELDVADAVAHQRMKNRRKVDVAHRSLRGEFGGFDGEFRGLDGEDAHVGVRGEGGASGGEGLFFCDVVDDFGNGLVGRKRFRRRFLVVRVETVAERLLPEKRDCLLVDAVSEVLRGVARNDHRTQTVDDRGECGMRLEEGVGNRVYRLHHALGVKGERRRHVAAGSVENEEEGETVLDSEAIHHIHQQDELPNILSLKPPTQPDVTQEEIGLLLADRFLPSTPTHAITFEDMMMRLLRMISMF